MIDMSKITVRRTGQGGHYGAPIHPDDLRAEVADEIAEAIVQRDEDSGEVEVGGQRYWWTRGDFDRRMNNMLGPIS